MELAPNSKLVGSENGPMIVDELDEQNIYISLATGPAYPFFVVKPFNKSDKMCVSVADAIALIDAHGLNATANDMLAKLEQERDCGQDGPCAVSPGCQRHWSERNCELVEQLAIANEAIASLRQRDTVRPEVSLAKVYAEGFRDGYQARDPDGYTCAPTNGNPYKDE